MNNAIGYIRVSTANQADNGVSLEAQANKIRAYCELHDLTLIEIIEDAGLSGKTIAGRPGMQHVIELVKAHKVSDVIIFKLDRLARNVREANEIADLMAKKGVNLHSISEKIDTGSATGKLFFNILAAMGQWEREIISERTVMALQTLKSNNRRVSGRAPFGYSFQNDGTLAVNADEQKVITRIRELRSAGFTIMAIRSQLTADGFLNRNGREFGRNEIWTITKKAA